MALMRIQKKNYETIRISYFQPTEADSGESLLAALELGIPFNMGDYAAAAAMVGMYENFLLKTVKEEEIDQATKETVERCRTLLAGLKEVASKEEKSGLIICD